MIPIHEFNRVVFLVSSLPLEKKKTVGVEAVGDRLERIAIRAVDVDLDEISMRNNMRSQLYKIISKNNYLELVRRIKEKLTKY